jgi:hypothetical protein
VRGGLHEVCAICGEYPACFSFLRPLTLTCCVGSQADCTSRASRQEALNAVVVYRASTDLPHAPCARCIIARAANRLWALVRLCVEAGPSVRWWRRTLTMACVDGNVWLEFRLAQLLSFCCESCCSLFVVSARETSRFQGVFLPQARAHGLRGRAAASESISGPLGCLCFVVNDVCVCCQSIAFTCCTCMCAAWQRMP